MAPNKNIFYSEKHNDDKFEYQQVVLPEGIAELPPDDRDRVAETGGPAEQGMGPLHGLRARTPHASLQEGPLSFAQPENQSHWQKWKKDYSILQSPGS